jgi:hypothetical protein
MSLTIILTLVALATFSLAFDWDYMNCHNHGTYVSQFNATQGHCNCTSSWTGVDCSICSTSSTCGSGRYCQKDFLVGGYTTKSFSCVAPTFLNTANNSISVEFDPMGTANLTVFATVRGAPLVFNCSLTGCAYGGTWASCSNTTCHCTSWCNNIQAAIVQGMKGVTRWSCTSSGACTLFNSPMVNAKTQCIASSCEYLTNTTMAPSGPNTTAPWNSTDYPTSWNYTNAPSTWNGTDYPSNWNGTAMPTLGPCTTIPKQDCIEVCGAGHVKVCQCIHGEPYVECDSAATILLLSWVTLLLALLLV